MGAPKFLPYDKWTLKDLERARNYSPPEGMKWALHLIGGATTTLHVMNRAAESFRVYITNEKSRYEVLKAIDALNARDYKIATGHWPRNYEAVR